MQSRRFLINSFRNIGVKEEKPFSDDLIVNNSTDIKDLGEFLVVVGPNNSGKSNVLDALLSFGNRSFSPNDVCNFLFKETLPPSIIFSVNNDNLEYHITFSQTGFELKELRNGSEIYNVDNILLLTELQLMHNFLSSNISRNPNLRALRDSFVNIQVKSEDVNKIDMEVTLKKYIDFVRNIPHVYKTSILQYAIQNKNKMPFATSILNNSFTFDNLHFVYENVFKDFESNFLFNLIPNIIKYEKKPITNDDLSVSPKDVKNSVFFQKIFKEANYSLDDVVNIYNSRNEEKYMNFEREIEKKLDNLTKRFNQMFFEQNDLYSFMIRLEENKIKFFIKRNQTFISLNSQSTGFRWFFDLFFNLILSSNLVAGDIIILDEPATNLHVKGQEELAKFLREFAYRNSIVIIIATHSPFFVDIDHLNDLRIVSNEGVFARIDNNFAFNLERKEKNTDTLKTVLDSLTIDRRIIIDPQKTLVFVEGITDYNYLTAMKILLNEDNFVFLPINGLSKNYPNNHEKDFEIKRQKYNELLKIRKTGAILLCDGDEAGKATKEANKDRTEIKIVLLTDIFKHNVNIKIIEHLFSLKDLKSFCLLKQDNKKNIKKIENIDGRDFVKSEILSAQIKHRIIYNKILNSNDNNTINIAKDTKENFKKLFKYLNKIVNN